MLELSEKRLNRTIVTLAWPAILESLLQLTVYLTDSIMIGPLGTEAFAAVGQGSMLVHYITFPLWGIGTAVGAIVSRNIGRQDRVAAEQGAGQGLLLAGLSGAIFTVVGFLYGRDILLLLGTPPEVIEPCTDYLVTVLAFNTFYSVRMVGSSILRALGDTKTPMIATAAMNVFNIAANYVLIYGIGPFPRMETTGVALASGLSFVISAVMVCWKLFDHPGGFKLGLGNIVRLRRAVMGNIMRIAAPSCAQLQ